jgi:endoglucanase
LIWTLVVLVSVIILAWVIINILEVFTYPDMRAADRAKENDFTKAFNVKRAQNRRSGINLGCTEFQDSPEGCWGVNIKEHDFDALRNAGFYYIRIHVRFLPRLIKSGGTYRLEDEFLRRLDWAIENILKRDMIAIIDFYYFLPDTQFSFESSQERIQLEEKFLAIWKILAQRYKDYPSHLYFELANEPHKPISPDIWNTYVEKALVLIRGCGGNNRTRKIVVGANILISMVHNWDHLNGIHRLKLPSTEEDPNIIVTFHYYNPLAFTYQGETYTPDLARVSRFWLGNTWDNTEKQKALVKKDLDMMSRWAEQNNREIILGEFSVSSHADYESQVKWTRLVREQAEARNMIWIYWGLYDIVSLAGIYNQSGVFWKEELLNALLPEDEWPPAGKEMKTSSFPDTDDAPGIRDLSALLKDPDWKIRKKGAASLRYSGFQAGPAVADLIRALEDEQWQVRQEAVRAIAAIGDTSPPVLSALIQALGDEQWQVRESAARTLAFFGPASEPVIPALAKVLGDEQWHVRMQAADALAAVGPASKPAVSALIKALEDEEWQVRRSAVRALAAIGPAAKTAIPALTEALNDEERQVRENVVAALSCITPEDPNVQKSLQE